MQNLAAVGLVELSDSESVEVNGGGEPFTSGMVAYASALITAFTTGFAFGYNELGPIVNGWLGRET